MITSIPFGYKIVDFVNRSVDRFHEIVDYFANPQERIKQAHSCMRIDYSNADMDNDPEVIKTALYRVLAGIEDTSLFNTLIKEIPYCKSKMCKDWNDGLVLKLPDVMDCPYTNILRPYCEQLSITHWILFKEDGSVELLTPYQNNGLYSANSKELYRFNEKPDAMPDGVVKAVQLLVGSTLMEDNTLRGFSWRLYAK